MSNIKRGDKVQVVGVTGIDIEQGIKVGNIYTVAAIDPDGDIYIPCLEVNPHNTKPYDYSNYVDRSDHVDGYVLYLSQVEVINE